jgi:hypothetical protein
MPVTQLEQILAKLDELKRSPGVDTQRITFKSSRAYTNNSFSLYCRCQKRAEYSHERPGRAVQQWAPT